MLDARFDATVGPCLPALYRMAYRLTGNSADADDLFQEACLRACVALRESQTFESPIGWLASVQYRVFLRRVERAGLPW